MPETDHPDTAADRHWWQRSPWSRTGSRWVQEGSGWVRDRGHQIAVVLGLTLVVLGTAGFLGVYDAVQDRDDLAELDEPVLGGLVAARSGTMTAVLTAVSTVTGPVVLPVIVVAATLVWGFVRRSWWQAGLLAGAMVLSTLVSMTLKAAVARPRPPVDTMSVPGYETTYSFPSGHTIATATLLLVIGYLAWVRRPQVGSLVAWAVLVTAGTGLVAVSRLYLGYHFVTDVLASMALAIAILGLVIALDRRRAVHAARATHLPGTRHESAKSIEGERPRQDSNLRPAD